MIDYPMYQEIHSEIPATGMTLIRADREEMDAEVMKREDLKPRDSTKIIKGLGIYVVSVEVWDFHAAHKTRKISAKDSPILVVGTTCITWKLTSLYAFAFN